jgi:hypothetical protein
MTGDEGRNERTRTWALGRTWALLPFAVLVAAGVAWALHVHGASCDYGPASRIHLYLCLHPRVYFLVGLAVALGVALVVGWSASRRVRALSLWFVLPLAFLAWVADELLRLLWGRMPGVVERHSMFVAWLAFIPLSLVLVCWFDRGCSDQGAGEQGAAPAEARKEDAQ